MQDGNDVSDNVRIKNNKHAFRHYYRNTISITW
ncbi:MAG: hypothetical protein ACLR31_10205 [Escherichia coli]